MDDLPRADLMHDVRMHFPASGVCPPDLHGALVLAALGVAHAVMKRRKGRR